VLWWHWGRPAFLPTKPRLAFPLTGLVELFRHTVAVESSWQALQLAELYLLLAFLCATAFVIRRSRARAVEKLSWLLFVVMVCPLAAHVWEEDWGFFRILSEFYVLGWIVLLGARSRLVRPLAGAWTALWAFLFVTRAG
jgi:hypothetical protein